MYRDICKNYLLIRRVNITMKHKIYMAHKKLINLKIKKLIQDFFWFVFVDRSVNEG